MSFLSNATIFSQPNEVTSNIQESNDVSFLNGATLVSQPEPNPNLLEKSKSFDETTFGKVTNTINNVLGSISPGKNIPLTKELEYRSLRKQDQERRGVNLATRILEDIGDDAKQSLERTARFIPYAIPVAKGAGVISALQKANPIFKTGKVANAVKTLVGASAITGSTAATIGGSKFIEELSKGESVEDSAKDALDAGVTSGAIALALPVAMQATGKGISSLSNKIAPFTKKTASQINEVLTSVPAKDFEFALDRELKGDSIFKGAFDSKRSYNAIGKRVQKAINYIDKKAGEAVGKEVEALRNVDIKINTDKIIKNLDEMINQKSFGGETSLKPNDIKVLNSFRSKLLRGDGEVHAAKLGIIKKQINNELPKSSFSTETVSKISQEGEGVLKKLAQDISNEISEKVPSVGKVNKEFSKIRELRDRLRPLVRDTNVARNVKNLYKKDVFIPALFEELDELAPTGLKFQDKLSAVTARDAFSQLSPEKGGGFQGFLNNIVRGSVIAGVGATSGALSSAGVALALSPAIGGKSALKTSGLIGRYTNLAPELLNSLSKTSASRLPAIKITEDK
jgi:hypothetical protein